MRRDGRLGGRRRARVLPRAVVAAVRILVFGGAWFLTPVRVDALVRAAARPLDDRLVQQSDRLVRQSDRLVQQSAVDLEELVADATAAVVTIEVRVGDDARQGSGFIVDPGGIVLTNHHVVRGATAVKVRLASGDVYEHVSLLARDERRDIAILKIPGFGLPVLPLGNSDSVRVGSPAIAIGSPLGLENTVSTGIVSGRRRETEGYEALQITAPASAGSSGGPVLSRDGRVIGIASSQIRQGQNLNFAIPINYARGMLPEAGRQTLAEFSPASEAPVREATDMSADTKRVNRGLEFDLSGLEEGTQATYEARGPTGRLRTTRVTLRRLRDVADRETRLERFVESETTTRRGPEESSFAIRRERRRTIVDEEDLRPVSARGQIDWRVADGEWRHSSYDLRFEDGRVLGTIQDSSGVVSQVDRALPDGILIRDMRDVAFGALVANPLLGRSVELVSFDPYTGQRTTDRYDVRWRTKIRVLGEEREALVVDVASGLVNERTHFTVNAPRTLLRRATDEDDLVEEIVMLHPIPPPESGGH